MKAKLVLGILVINLILSFTSSKLRYLGDGKKKNNTSPKPAPAPKPKPAPAPKPEPEPAPASKPKPAPKPAPAPANPPSVAGFPGWRDDRNFFLRELKVGNPPQTVTLSLDTGVDVSWIPSKSCSECVEVDQTFDSKKSSSYSTNKKAMVVRDTDGNANGILSTDDVSLDRYKAPGFSFVLVDRLDKGYTDYKSGKLAFPYKSSNGDTFLDVLKNNDQIGNKVISLQYKDNLGNFRIEYPPEMGVMDIKRLNRCKVTADLENLAEEFRNKWVCDLSSGTIGKDMKNSFDINGFAFFDSASSIITAPLKFQAMFKEKYTSLCVEGKAENGDILYDCDKAAIDLSKYRSLYFVLAGWAYKVPKISLFKPTLDGNKYTFAVRFSKNSSVWGLGQPFMSGFTTIFNQEEGSVGFWGGKMFNYNKKLGKTQKVSDKDGTTGAVSTPSSAADNEKKMKLIFMVGGGIIAFVVVLLILCCICRCVRKPVDDDLKPMLNNEAK